MWYSQKGKQTNKQTAISLVGIPPKGMKMCLHTALFIIAKKKKKEETTQCQSTGEQLNFSTVTMK